MRAIPPNVCGSCTLCCKVLSIPELPKASGTWCAHASRAHGCAIYETRPSGCRAFHCGWLLHGLAPELRPDRIHGVIDAIDDTSFVLHEDPGWPAYARVALRGVIQRFVTSRAGRYVVVLTGACRTLIGPPDLTLEPTTAPDTYAVLRTEAAQ